MFGTNNSKTSAATNKHTCNELIDPTCTVALVPYAQPYNGAGIPQGRPRRGGNERVVGTFVRVQEEGVVYDTTVEATIPRLPPKPPNKYLSSSLDGDTWLPGFTE
jgi:hypothetical protein